MLSPHELLRQTWLFDDLPDAEIDYFVREAQPQTYHSGQYLYHERTPRDALYVIASGQVCLLHGIGQAPVTVTAIGPGSVLGERLLLGDPTHVLSAQAMIEVTLLALFKPAFERFAQEKRPLYEALVLKTTRRLREGMNGSLAADEPDRPAEARYRTEHDLLGERQVPAEALYGVQTLRAIENFPITGNTIGSYPYLIEALACIKLAAARANAELKLLDETRQRAIETACDEIRAGQHHDQFVVDAIQGGAGTSTNMNANEVIANRALELLGRRRGDYAYLHPLNHVNMSQSTNDVYPTAIKIALWFSVQRLIAAMDELKNEFNGKAEEFKDILKIGRTQLQDAVPMTLGQEFSTYAVMLNEDQQRLREASLLIREINMGATAIGTGITAHPDYAGLVCRHLSAITGIPLQTAPNLIEATQDAGVFVQLSGVLKRVAVKLSKTCNDLRLLSSGPRAGLGEINLPPMQPGSTIMPGKVNPVIPEVVNQVAFEVIGNDMTVTMAAEAGQLQLNAFEPIIAYSLFNSITHLRNACVVLAKRCVSGITANRDFLRRRVEHSIGLVTALNPYIGYENATRIASDALATGESVYDLVLSRGLLSKDELDDILKPENMTQPRWVDVGRE
ncbi:MAG TPA: aspartate ammonia-lyase [Aggregatilineales bacterium]|nr:aspartate ammonia-lyase [Aggregatilineales bacterium]